MTISFPLSLCCFPMRVRRVFGRNWHTDFGIKSTSAACTFNTSRCASRRATRDSFSHAYILSASKTDRRVHACAWCRTPRACHAVPAGMRLGTSIRSHGKEALSRRAPVAKRIGHHPYRRSLVYRGSDPPLVAGAANVCTRLTGFISVRSSRNMMDRCISVLIRLSS